MNDKQKLIFRQIQLAGLGIVISVFGYLYKNTPFIYIGIFVLVLGIIRAWGLKKLVDKLEKEDETV